MDKTDGSGDRVRKMITKTVDLYGYYGQKNEEASGGGLCCWIPEISAVVGFCRKRPAILIFPGGGYHHVSDREAEPVALRFAARGYAAFVLKYSCAPARFPSQLREAAMAIRYIREHAESFAVNPEMVACLGFSAGGHLCGLLGTMYDAPEVADLGQPELLRPDGLCLCYPVTVSRGKAHMGSFVNLCGEDWHLLDRLSLDQLVRPDMPPVFLWHTREDESVPCRGSLMLALALEEAGVDFTMHLYHRGKHGLSTADAMAYPVTELPEISRDVPGWIEGCIQFFEETGLKILDREVAL